MTDMRRWLLATVFALIVHLTLVPWLPRQSRPHVEHVTAVKVSLIRIKPVPRPKVKHHRPKPVVKPRRHVHVVRIHVAPGARTHGKPHHTRIYRRAAAPVRAVMRHELARPSARPVPMASIVPTPDTVTGAGMQGSEHNGPVVAGGGAGGNAAAGNGDADRGTGAGAIPCGEPELVSMNRKVVDGQIRHTIQATLHFPDGSTESATFPYPFIYGPNEDDPFDRRNRNNPAILTLVQFPPAGYDRSTLPPLIRIILSRTSAEGLSILNPCPDEPAR